MKKIFIITFVIVFPLFITSAQENILGQFALTPTEDILNQPLYIDLQGLDYNEDIEYLVLYRVEGEKKIKIPSQLETGYTARLWFIPGSIVRKGDTIELVLVKKPVPETVNYIRVKTDESNITLSADEKEILSYRHAWILQPEGTSPLYRRKGGYIHPLKSPSGKILTCIQPPDHYHHYGIWNPWTKVYFEGREVDFWNLAKGQGTVMYAGTLSTYSGELFGGFKVLHKHIDFTAPGEDKVALSEVWDIRAWSLKVNDQLVWLIDFTFVLSCATDSVVKLVQYRYGGGIGFRATETWTNENSTVLTSEGKTRIDADASHARWCRLVGETGLDETSGIIFMSHPANRAHPEPMRVWPENANNGRGDLFFEFCPIRHEDWILYPNKEYVLKYRVVVFDGFMEKDTADKLWHNFAYPTSIKMQIK